MNLPVSLRTIVEVVLTLALILAAVGYCQRDARTAELEDDLEASTEAKDRALEQVEAYQVALSASDSVEGALRDSLTRERAEAADRAEEAAEGVDVAAGEFEAATVELDTALAVLSREAPPELLPYVQRVEVATDSMQAAHARALASHERFRESMERQVALLERVSASKDRSIAQRDSLIAAQDSALDRYREALGHAEELIDHLQGGSLLDLFGSELPKTVAQIGGCFGVSRVAQEFTPEEDRDPGFWWKAGGICAAELAVSKSW